MIRTFSFLLGITFLTLAHIAEAGLFGCVQSSNTCTDANSTHLIQPYNCGTCAPVPVTEACWNYAETWTCYTGTQSTSCSSTNLTGCSLVNSTPIAWDSSGTAISWDETFTCPGQATSVCTTPTPLPANSVCNTTGATTTCSSSVYGSCTDSSTQTECSLGPAPACNTNPDCSLSNTACAGAASGGSYCESVLQSYSCSTAQTSCVKMANVSSCVGNLTWGLDQGTTPQPNNGFGQAMSSLTLLQAIQHSANQDAVTVFSGIAETCEQGSGLGSLLYADCCSINLQATGTNGALANACDQQDVLLAASRRAGLAVYIGNYCSLSDILLGCLKTAQTYCTFDNALAEAVNVQGRAQLAAMAAAGQAQAQTSGATSFAYYASAGNTTGNWLALPATNGNEAYVFQWPAYCASPSATATQMQADPTSLQCPTTIELYFASCAGTTSPTCNPADLPSDPSLPSNVNNGSGSVIEWNIQPVTDVLDTISTAVDRYVAVTGSCTAATGICGYTVAGWPAGVGGTAVVRSNMSFLLYAGGYQSNQSFELTQYIVVPQSLSAPVTAATLPATISLQVSSDGGNTFNTVSVPTTILAPGITLQGTPVQIYGSCNASSQQCDYQLTLPVTVTAMSWGTAQATNCSGFTLTDLAVLDFSKMNLSQWLSSIVPPAAPDSAALTTAATTQVNALTSAYQSTGTGPSLPAQGNTASQAFIVTPDAVDGQAVTFVATTNWPQQYTTPAANTNPVSSVQVNWGDGTTDSATLGTYNGQPAFTDSHTYAVPASNYINYTVTATFQTASSGPQTSTATVESYATPTASGNLGTNGGGNGATNSSGATYAPVQANTLTVPGVPTKSLTP